MEFKTEIIERGELTKRESQIVEHVCNGWSNRQIADRLFIALVTVEDHLENIHTKLEIKESQLNRRIALLRTALARGMVRLVS